MVFACRPIVTESPSSALTKTLRVIKLVHTHVMSTMRSFRKKLKVRPELCGLLLKVSVWFLLKMREVPDRIKASKAFYENHWGEYIDFLRSDNRMDS